MSLVYDIVNVFHDQGKKPSLLLQVRYLSSVYSISFKSRSTV